MFVRACCCIHSLHWFETMRALGIRTLVGVAALATIPCVAALAQDSAHKPLSPRDTSRATIGGAHILIDYGRPSKRGREIFGALVPYDKVWRTGANAATTLVTDADLVIGGAKVSAGTYTLYTIPAKDSAWRLIINKQTGQWGTDYDSSQDLARVPMTVASIKSPVEKFEITFDAKAMHLRWDTTDATVPVSAK